MFMRPYGWSMRMPAPMAEATLSSTGTTLRTPASMSTSTSVCRSLGAMPPGSATSRRGLNAARLPTTLRTKKRSILLSRSKLRMRPSRSGCSTIRPAGVRPYILRASSPTAMTSRVCLS